MRNVEISVDGKYLTAKIDITKRLGKSKSGKSDLVATTGGNIPVADGIRFGCTAFFLLPEEEWPPEAKDAKKAPPARAKR